MKIFSQTTHSFVLKLEKFLKEIITQEVGLKVRRSRFEYQAHSYPLHVVCFISKSSLGFFDPHSYQIGLNYQLMLKAKDKVLKDILRHEFAHYLCFVEQADDQRPHGPYFQEVCKRYNWEACVSKASLDIELANHYEGHLANEKILTKIKALLSLAQSDNIHEAQLATLKANQLLLKYNLENLDKNIHETYIYTDRVLSAKRKNAKINAIYDILKHFLVRPVLVYGHKKVFLEVCGSKENIELAFYIADFLDQELERLWNQQSQLKGLAAKNSFFYGVAKGFEEKMQTTQKDFSVSEKKALIRLKDDLDQKLNLVYRRLSSTSGHGSFQADAYSKGKKTGKNLTINSALKNQSKTKFLTWS